VRPEHFACAIAHRYHSSPIDSLAVGTKMIRLPRFRLGSNYKVVLAEDTPYASRRLSVVEPFKERWMGLPRVQAVVKIRIVHGLEAARALVVVSRPQVVQVEFAVESLSAVEVGIRNRSRACDGHAESVELLGVAHRA